MSAKHTPGPWIVKHNPVRLAVLALVDGSYVYVAESIRAVRQEEAEANAYLISAAPNLLAACREAADLLSGAGYSTSELRDAIAKAEGN